MKVKSQPDAPDNKSHYPCAAQEPADVFDILSRIRKLVTAAALARASATAMALAYPLGEPPHIDGLEIAAVCLQPV